MLGNPTYDIGIFFQQFFIALSGRVFYPGKEQLLIEVKPVYKFFFILLPQRRGLPDKMVKFVSLYRQNFRRLNALQ